MIRELIARFNRTIAEKTAAPRIPQKSPIKISIELNVGIHRTDAPQKTVFLSGETVDLSRSGIGFIVASIRIKEDYLVGSGLILTAEIDLPVGRIAMKIVGERYEQISESVSDARYFIGASIREMNDKQRAIYNNFLNLRQRKRRAGNLKFGVSER